MVAEGSNLKEKLITEGTKIVQREGMKNVSLRRVAEICGVTHSSPYRHFKNKNEYLKALVDQISIVFGSSIAKGITGDMRAEDILLKMGINFVEFARSFPNYFDVLFLGDYIVQTKVQDNQLTADEYLPGFEEFKNIVYKVSNDNNLDIAQDIEVVQLWSFIIGFALIIGKKDVTEAQPEWIEEVIKKMITTYIRGNQKK